MRAAPGVPAFVGCISGLDSSPLRSSPASHPAYDHAKKISQMPTIMSPTGTAAT
jgi:hypothetical protein